MFSFRSICIATSVFLSPALAAAEDFARQGQQALEQNDPKQASPRCGLSQEEP